MAAGCVQGGEEALFVDPAVYTRNRAFRLYLSSKAGKQVEAVWVLGGEPATCSTHLQAGACSAA